jgi:hypothetical protein
VKLLRVGGSTEEVEPLITIFPGRRGLSDRPGSNPIERGGISPPSPALSRVEYWSFLCAAAMLGAAILIPGRSRGNEAFQHHSAGGAFGTSRSTDEPRVIQHERAEEPGRGRHADAPWQIPFRGWKDILWRTYQQIGEDRLLAVAAGVVFYALLALFPAITALVSLYGLLRMLRQ